MPLIILSILVQLILVVHIIKTGRNTIWIWVIVLIPLVGTLAYFIVELLPEIFASRSAKNVSHKLNTVLNPDEDIKQAVANFSASDTVENSVRLAQRCVDRSMFFEARHLYKNCLKGVHLDDPELTFGVAMCDFELGHYVEAKNLLDHLIETNPEYKNQEAHLLYARNLDRLGDADAAKHEYETLYGYYSGVAAHFYYAQFLRQQGDKERALKIFEEIVAKGKHSSPHYNELYGVHIEKAKVELNKG